MLARPRADVSRSARARLERSVEVETYPILNFLVSHGRKLAVGLAILTLGFCAAVSIEQMSWPWSAAGPIGAVLVYGFVASYAELVRLVTDMLLPK
jgi:hypothetical protein